MNKKIYTMKSNYKSIPVIASVIGSKTRKAMYIVNVTNLKGTTLYKDKWIPCQWGQDKRIKWEYHSQSFVEFPMSKASQAMQFESYDLTNISRFNTKLVNGKKQRFYEMVDRYIIHVPVWLINSFEVVGRRSSDIQQDINTSVRFSSWRDYGVDEDANDDNPESVAEQTAIDSRTEEHFSYRPDRDSLYLGGIQIESSDSHSQWIEDHPEYH
jgi:hypothetical protein